MTTYLRDLPDGTRFVLCRSGEKFVLMSGGRWSCLVRREGSDKEMTLHHSSHVKPVVRADVTGGRRE